MFEYQNKINHIQKRYVRKCNIDISILRKIRYSKLYKAETNSSSFLNYSLLRNETDEDAKVYAHKI